MAEFPTRAPVRFTRPPTTVVPEHVSVGAAISGEGDGVVALQVGQTVIYLCLADAQLLSKVLAEAAE